ncbi:MULTISPECIES: PEP-CTERM sorting domain-containing protein [Moorena]|uniref:Putative exosortase, PEP-CTERM interaction domain protein n=1 Tax=Moorena producens 3L TaxID=489825 RepID=F4Y1J6_9CYAN|nr:MULTISPECIES: PEP-CTERM sorting domain-containing protein [Moorena]EGJ29138.1 putative exosortase, PEP-CTERM interaction domain protein [Moorena producens 3L]NEP32146.1 PEP-CTERM sorting domain-containing protein [Moorena sp. SIO3B2]NEP70186.1 PEP-CTERM sorting domain-containing protein [Moorena sp. SIO3A5]NEQ06215.1 PEP-CTERM sorting domain-containing protein [Moorena sp. SIO4E2]NER92149.1 PEP-CTERM sorting domain-containing protein [Moorena sp. SIO3A2]
MKKLPIAMAGAVVFSLGTIGTAQAASFLSTSNGQVGKIDTSTGKFTPLNSDGIPFFDIALSNSGELFGVTPSALYSIDKSTGLSSLIGYLFAFINALGFSDDDNVLYGAGDDSFYTIDTSSGAASLVATIPNFNSSGDIAFDSVNNQFFATSLSVDGSSDILFSIANDGTATEIGSIGFRDIFGLFFENGTLFGYTADRQQITIDPTTGAGTFSQNVAFGGINRIFGAAAVSKTTVPEPMSVLSLLAVGAFGASVLSNHKL